MVTEVEKKCPFWQRLCSEVCPTWSLNIEIVQQKQILGITKIVKSNKCCLPALADIMSSRPVQQNIPHGPGLS